MNPHTVQPHEIESLLRYWRECGIDFLCGDTPGAWREFAPAPPAPAPRAAQPAAQSAARPTAAAPPYDDAPPWEMEPGAPARSASRPERPANPPQTHSAPIRDAAPTPTAPRWNREQAAPPPPTPPVSAPQASPPPRTGTDLPPLPPPIPLAERPPLLANLAQQVAACQQCDLHKTRTQTVFGVGTPTTPVVFVGEAPGADEDRQGEPFVGAAGKLLDAMIRSVGFQRSEIYIANVLKCRPPGNRNPTPEEVALCHAYLFTQLEIIQPRLLLAMGKFAISTLTGHDGPVGEARGRLFHWRGIPVIPTYHPAYYLRQPGRKRAAWDDLLRLLQALHNTPAS